MTARLSHSITRSVIPLFVAEEKCWKSLYYTSKDSSLKHNGVRRGWGKTLWKFLEKERAEAEEEL